MSQQELKLKPSIVGYPLLFVLFIWFVYWVEIQFGFNFNKFGILPRSFEGLQGIVFFHFIHSDTNHLINNSIPLLILLSSLLLFYREVGVKVLLIGGLLTGLFTWFIGRPAYHIGASGLVYLLFSFICFSGIIKKHFRLVALSLIIIFTYGSMVWYVLPIKEGMSWEGHLSGFVIGLLFAFYYRKKGIVRQPYFFKESEFDQLFDDDGNLKDDVDKKVE